MTALTDLTATELAEAIHLKRVSSLEALRAHLERIEKYNPSVNAIVTMNPRAEAEARTADNALARGELLGPLHGVPITIKDCFETAGLRTTSGFEPWKDYIPREDAPTVAKLRRAGAVMIGKTNLPSLAGDSQTDNTIFGRTNNPWGLGWTPGGSSGGEAAAIAARLTPLGLGSDIGGSIRQPCHCCAIFGIKPTEHLVSTAGYLEGRSAPRGERHMNSVGPMARSIADLDLALRLVAGPDRRFLEAPPVALEPRPLLSLRDLRVAWVPALPGLPTARVVSDGLRSLASRLQPLVAASEETAPRGIDFAAALVTWGTIYQAEGGAAWPPEEEREMAARYGAIPSSPDPYLGAMGRAVNAGVRLLAAALTERDRIAAAWEDFFDRWDVFLCPVSLPAIDHCAQGTPQAVDGRTYPYGFALDSYTMQFNLTGHPGVALPLGLTDDGRPFGYQAVGRRWGDIRLLAAAEALALVSGPCPRPPGY